MATEKLKVGQIERREGYVEMPHEFVERLENHVREEEALFKAVKLYGFIVSAFVAVLIWIFAEKNADIKAMQQTLQTHSVQINETLTILKNEMQVNRSQQDRIDKNTEKIYGIPNK